MALEQLGVSAVCHEVLQLTCLRLVRHPHHRDEKLLLLLLHVCCCRHCTHTPCRLSSYWDVLTRPPPGTVVHLVRGERSDRWTPHMLQQLQEAQESWQEHAAEAPESVGQLQVSKTGYCSRASWFGGSDRPEPGILASKHQAKLSAGRKSKGGLLILGAWGAPDAILQRGVSVCGVCICCFLPRRCTAWSARGIGCSQTTQRASTP